MKITFSEMLDEHMQNLLANDSCNVNISAALEYTGGNLKSTCVESCYTV